MTKKTLKLNNVRVNKKKFNMSKEPIDLMSVNIDQIVVPDKFKLNNKDSKYFIGYQKGEIVKPYVYFTSNEQVYKKYFEYESPNKSFLINMNEWEKNTNKFGM